MPPAHVYDVGPSSPRTKVFFRNGAPSHAYVRKHCILTRCKSGADAVSHPTFIPLLRDSFGLQQNLMSMATQTCSSLCHTFFVCWHPPRVAAIKKGL